MSHQWPKAPPEVLKQWREWSPMRLACDATVLVIAPRGAGKTTFIIDCIYHRGNTRKGMILCPTPEIYKTYGKYFPMLFCHQDFDESFERQFGKICKYQFQKSLEADGEHLRWMRERQKEVFEQNKIEWDSRVQALEERGRKHGWSETKFVERLKKEDQKFKEEVQKQKIENNAKWEKRRIEKREPHSWFCIFDDLGFSNEAKNSKNIEYAVKNGRHIIMQQFYAIQGPMDLKSGNRDQIDVVAFSPLITMGNIDRFINEYMPTRVNKKVFEQILATFCKYGWWLVVERRTRSPDPREFIYRYQASFDPLPTSHFGHPACKWMQMVMFDPWKAARTVNQTDPDDPTASPEQQKTSREAEVQGVEILAQYFMDLVPGKEGEKLKSWEEEKAMAKRNSKRKHDRERHKKTNEFTNTHTSQNRSRSRSRSRSKRPRERERESYSRHHPAPHPPSYPTSISAHSPHSQFPPHPSPQYPPHTQFPPHPYPQYPPHPQFSTPFPNHSPRPFPHPHTPPPPLSSPPPETKVPYPVPPSSSFYHQTQRPSPSPSPSSPSPYADIKRPYPHPYPHQAGSLPHPQQQHPQSQHPLPPTPQFQPQPCMYAQSFSAPIREAHRAQPTYAQHYVYPNSYPYVR